MLYRSKGYCQSLPEKLCLQCIVPDIRQSVWLLGRRQDGNGIRKSARECVALPSIQEPIVRATR